MADKQQEMEEIMNNYKMLETRLDTLAKQREVVATNIAEIRATIDSITEIENSNEMLFAIGRGAFVKGRTLDKKNVLVNIGAEVFIEKSAEDGKKSMEARQQEFEKVFGQIEKEMINISSLLEQLNLKMQTLL
ncbi:MAG TPA: prefoldin subunit alpha [archaeon]|nr:prefoldin subunit alpha [archaeon]